MTGYQFKELSDYIKEYNRTIPFYETWRVRNSTDHKHYKEWFTPSDCASYVQKVFCKAAQHGAQFNKSYVPDYTFITLISDEPIKLGNVSSIFGELGKNADLAQDIMSFYSDVQAHQPTLKFAESLLSLLDYIILKEKFYLYYNGEYWQLPMKPPFVKLTYEPVTFKYCYK